MPRTICMLTSVHAPFDPRIFHREARSLAAAGYGVTLIAPHDRREETRDGVRIVGLPPTRSRLGRPLNWLRLLRLARRERADAYHFHDPELIPWGLLLRGLTGRPVVYDAHEHYPDMIRVKEWIIPALRKLVSNAFDTFERVTAGRFDAIIVADDDVERRFQPYARKLVKLYNFPHRALFSTGSSILSVSEPPRHPIQLIYVGLMSVERGIYLMLDTLALLHHTYKLEAGLWLVGRMSHPDIENNFRQRLANDNILAEHVWWPGTLPHQELPALLEAATIGWVPFFDTPKLRKNIATKQFEYMACGLPILGSDLPPIRRFVEPVEAGILASPGNPQAHAEAIIYLTQHPSQMKRMGNRGREAFLTDYNWSTEETKLIRLYNELVGPPEKSNAE